MPTAPLLSYHKLNHNTLQTYQFHSLADTVHAVFTRHGGLSEGPFSSLNLSYAVGDVPSRVTANFQRACTALNTHPQQTAECRLEHGHTVLSVSARPTRQNLGVADGLISNTPGIMLTMRFADCVPLLFYDPVQAVVGLAHAGWRGTAQDMMGAMFTALRQKFNCQPADVRVVIGPSIGPCCYEVKEDVWAALGKTFADPGSVFQQRGGRLYLDMWQANLKQARRAGAEQITLSELCTACNTEDFYSHRAENGQTGRFGVFIGLKPVWQNQRFEAL